MNLILSRFTIMKCIIILFVLLSNISFCQNEPKNLIIFIGDGMGSNQIKVSELYSGEVYFKNLFSNKV